MSHLSIYTFIQKLCILLCFIEYFLKNDKLYSPYNGSIIKIVFKNLTNSTNDYILINIMNKYTINNTVNKKW